MRRGNSIYEDASDDEFLNPDRFEMSEMVGGQFTSAVVDDVDAPAPQPPSARAASAARAVQINYALTVSNLARVPELIKFVIVSILCVAGLIWKGFPFLGTGAVMVSPDGGVPWTLVLFSALFTAHFVWFLRVRCGWTISCCVRQGSVSSSSLPERLCPSVMTITSDGSWKSTWPGYVPPVPSPGALFVSLGLVFLSCAWLWIQVLALWLEPTSGQEQWVHLCVSYAFEGRTYNPAHIPGINSSISPGHWIVQSNIGMTQLVSCGYPSAPSLQNAILSLMFSNMVLLAAYGLASLSRPAGGFADKVNSSRTGLGRTPLTHAYLHHAVFGSDGSASGASGDTIGDDQSAVDTGGLDTVNNSPAEEPHAAGAWHGTFEGWFIVSCLTVGYVACITILIFFPSTWFAYYSGSPDSSFLVWTLSSANNHGGGPLPPSSVVFVGIPVLIASVPTAVLLGHFLVNRPITMLDTCIRRLQALFTKLEKKILLDGHQVSTDLFREHGLAWYAARKHINEYDNAILMQDIQGTTMISLLITVGMLIYLTVNVLTPYINACDNMEDLETSMWGGTGCNSGTRLSELVLSGFGFIASLATSCVLLHRLTKFADLAHDHVSHFLDVKLKMLHGPDSEELARAIAAIDFMCERLVSTSIAPRIFGCQITHSKVLYLTGAVSAAAIGIFTFVATA
jgi:hypothetical protein